MDHARRTSAPPEGGHNGGDTRRSLVYCLIPAELADSLHDPLRRHFRDDPSVEVVVESRCADRRLGTDRRAAATPKPPTRTERRKIRGAAGRRVADRRAPVVDVSEPPSLPRKARRHAAVLSFIERLEPTSQELEDHDTARLVARFQAGDRETFATLYSRYFDRVYGYVRVALRDSHEAEDLTQQVFVKVLEALGGYERRGAPFRSWLFRIVRNETVSQLRRSGVLEAQDPSELADAQDENGEGQAANVLDWITDRDLMIFVERLPLRQRQILLLSFGLDMSAQQIADIVDTNPAQVRSAKRHALNFLRARLAAVGRVPERHVRQHPRMRRWGTQALVLRRRRFALLHR